MSKPPPRRSRERGWGDPPLPHRLAGTTLLAATTAIRRMPGCLAYALADLASIAVVAFTLLHELRVGPRGRGLFRNQRIVFREELTTRRSWKLLFAWARHMAHLAVDFCRLPTIQAENLERHLDVRGIEELRPVFEEGGGLICVSGHTGFWELCGHAPSLMGIPVTVVVRPSSIGPVDHVLSAIRRSGGQEVLSKWRVLFSLKKALDRGRVIGFLADENAGDDAIFAPFLGTLAATAPTAAFLHRVTQAPIAVVSCHRTGRGRFRFHAWRVIRRAPTASREEDLRSVTEEINEALSRAILAYPEQWFWGSRRFLTRPPDEIPGPDGLPPRYGGDAPRVLAPGTRPARARSRR